MLEDWSWATPRGAKGYVRATRAVRAEDLDGVKLGLLGDAIGVGADSAGNVGAVAVAVSVGAVDKVGGECRTATELLFKRQHGAT